MWTQAIQSSNEIQTFFFLILFVFNVSSIFTTRFWLTWERTTSVLKMKMEHWSVSSANSPNSWKEWERDTSREPPPFFPPSIHPSLPPSTHSSRCQRERERGREAAECPTYMNTTAWLGLWCLSVNSWSGFCVPFNARLSQADQRHESLWLWPEAPTVATSDLTTASMSTAGPTHETRHLLRLCIRGDMRTHSYACITYFLDAHSTSAQGSLGLKAPT